MRAEVEFRAGQVGGAESGVSVVTCRSQCEFIRLYVCYGVCQPAASVIDIGVASWMESKVDSSRAAARRKRSV